MIKVSLHRARIILIFAVGQWLLGCPGNNGKLQPPSPPTGLQASSQQEAVDLIWNASSEDFVTGYNVYVSGTAGGPYTKVGESSAAHFLVSGLVYCVTT